MLNDWKTGAHYPEFSMIRKNKYEKLIVKMK